ncbi:MAG: hypothetical protein JST93_21545 [Acidobacteria bacterium]|nr:hypothetical protein [Acidobacteriota bacterium]
MRWLLAATLAVAAMGQSPRSYLVKLSVPVSAKASKAGDAVRAAVISPESLLNGYLEGTVVEAQPGPGAKLVLRFTRLVYKGKTTAIQTELTDFVNSIGHRLVDEEEKAVRVEAGAMRAEGADIRIDEGAELRVRTIP